MLVDHVTALRWVQQFTPLLIDAARPCRHVPGDRWFVDETYVKISGRTIYRSRSGPPAPNLAFLDRRDGTGKALAGFLRPRQRHEQHRPARSALPTLPAGIAFPVARGC